MSVEGDVDAQQYANAMAAKLQHNQHLGLIQGFLLIHDWHNASRLLHRMVPAHPDFTRTTHPAEPSLLYDEF